VFEVKSTAGNTHLGGDDWDQRVIDWMVAEFKKSLAEQKIRIDEEAWTKDAEFIRRLRGG